MSGLDLVRRLQEQDDMPSVILITALPDGHLDDDAISTGAQCLLRKPFAIVSLLDRVARSLYQCAFSTITMSTLPSSLRRHAPATPH
ncbi:hypothetical protein [Bradyrhizobium sp.]|uniref:hypothetical protein n=1 Tax=Bradyrhizobium sp. TaxID=376 RepID=UPI003C4D58D7